MTAAIPTRMLALAGIAVAALAAFLVARPLLLDRSDDAGSALESPAPATPGATPSRPSTPDAPSTKPRLELVPGLPARLAHELRYEKVVVVALYTSRAPLDARVVSSARAGADSVDAGFVALNVLDERTARQASKIAASTAPPAVAIVKRPGTVVTRFDGVVDAAVVAQAAANAGAGR